MNHTYKAFLFGLSTLTLNGCSVWKASSDDGIEVEEVRVCKTKAALIACGMQIYESKQCPDGKRMEIYKGRGRKGYCGGLRAVGHGLADVATLGLWELAATPIENSVANDAQWIVATAIYPNAHSDQIEKLTIVEQHSKQSEA